MPNPMYPLPPLPGFDRVVALDTEFTPVDGGHPIPICCVAHELMTGERVRLWTDELSSGPPFPTDDRTLHVAYMAAAEAGFYLACGWPMPTRWLDLFVEYRNMTNKALPKRLAQLAQPRAGLVDALEHFGIYGIYGLDKKSMQDLACRGAPFTEQERSDLLEYCESDVLALIPLLGQLLPHIQGRRLARSAPRRGLAQALHRGLYMPVVAQMERTGIPMDVETHGRIMAHREDIKAYLIEKGDQRYGVFRNGQFKDGLFRAYLSHHDLLDDWPLTKVSKIVCTDRDTMKDQARAHPQLEDLRQLLLLRSALQDNSLYVGPDGRNRTQLWAFGTATGRNSPLASQFVFGPSKWLRGLIKPAEGMALAYIDWSAQEIAIAAALSRDPELLKAAESGDPYLMFARRAWPDVVPDDANKLSHKHIRDMCKVALLGMNYGMQPRSLAAGAGLPLVRAQSLHRQLRRIYRPYHAWAQRMVDTGLLRGELHTYCGWRARAVEGTKPNTLQNFPAQSHGAEMLRHACCLLVARGVRVCAPIHDAVLIEARAEEIDAAVELTRQCMAQASREILDGFEVATEAETFVYPGRYIDPHGKPMWDLVIELLGQLAPV